MSVKRANFIVVALTGLDEYGFDEHTLPALVSLAAHSEPDYRTFSHTGVHAFYLSSPQAQQRADKLIADAKVLRELRKGYESLGIGTAEGPLLAEFTSLGNVKRDGTIPLGDASSQALKNAKTETGRIGSSSQP